MQILKRRASGPDVRTLQLALAAKGFDPGLIDGRFGPGVEAAVAAFQRSEGLPPDGVVGPHTQALLFGGTDRIPEPSGDSGLTAADVSKMCPRAPLANILANLPFIFDSLAERGIDDKQMMLMAIATIRAETARFEPINEGRSRYNTSPHGHAFDLYDNRRDLGNRGYPDGGAFRGRGFVQLTGRHNYELLDAQLHLGGRLVASPELANDPEIAAAILAQFLENNKTRIRAALGAGDMAAARRAVNGGSHGLKEFTAAYKAGEKALA